MTFKRQPRVHWLWKGDILCGIRPKNQVMVNRKRKNASKTATTEPEKVTCVSCRKASDRMLRTTHKDFETWRKHREGAEHGK